MQRAIDANVSVNHQIIGAFAGPGLVIFVGVTHTDSVSVAHTLAEKIYGLRIFDQEFVSQFDQLCVPPSSLARTQCRRTGAPHVGDQPIYSLRINQEGPTPDVGSRGTT